MPDVIHLLFPFVSYQFSLIVYIISLTNIISLIGVIVKDPAYCGTAESPVILSGNFVFVQIFRDLADAPSVSSHLENLPNKFCIFIRNQISRLVFLISQTAVQLPHGMTLSIFLLNRHLSQPSGIFAFCLGKCRKKSQQQFPFLGQRMDFLKFKIYINPQFLQLPGGFQHSICVAGKTGNGFGNNLPKTAFPGIFHHFAKSGACLFVSGNSKIIIYFCQNVIWGFLHKFLIMANLIFQGILLMGVKGGNAAVYCGGNG